MSEASDSASSSDYIRNKVCRLCLEEHWKLAHLENLYFDDIYFLDILRDCFNLEINLSQDHLPLLICRKCVTTTLNFHTFKNNIIENEVFLQSVNLDELNLKLKPELNEIGTNWHTPEESKRVHDDSSSAEVSDSAEEPLILTNLTTSLCSSHDKNDTLPKKYSNLEETSDNKILLADHVASRCDGFSSPESGYACSICSSYFGTQRYLTSDKSPRPCAHNSPLKKNGGTMEKKYMCTSCKKRFSKPHQWKDHMITHYTSQKYRCLQCNDSFDSKHELVVHTYTHLYKKTEEKSMKVRKLIKLYNGQL